MWHKSIALIATVITGASFATNSATAQTRVVTSDATAQFQPLELGKFVVINLRVAPKTVLVARPDIANALPQTATQYAILGVGVGQTNIAFYDEANRQIEAL